MRIHVMIMNTGGPGKAITRQNTVTQFVSNNNPELILFQEFQWHRQPERLELTEYEYHGTSTGIMLKRECFHIRDISERTLMNSLIEVQNSIVSKRSMGITGNDFDPVSRMYARIIKSDLGERRFVCISWHGWNNNIIEKGTMTRKRKLKFFRKFIEFLEKLWRRLKLPFIVAGDFNISRNRVRHVIKKSSFHFCSYRSSKRRSDRVIDYALVTDDLELDELHFLRDEIPTERGVLIFDHDPLKGTLKVY